ncbi:MAG: hypothetical protein WCP10_13025, partial [Desulfuromonadales bacterium]
VYAENQKMHRICEMNQDSYIYHRMNLGEIGESPEFSLQVKQCASSDDFSCLDSDISELWKGMFADVHPQLYAANPPDCDHWQRRFAELTDGQSPSGKRLFPLASVIAEKMGLAYPVYDKVDHQFIEEQLVPSGKPLHLHYDEIFDHALGNVTTVWRQVERAVCDSTANIPVFGEWNLDNGLDEHGRLVFWE